MAFIRSELTSDCDDGKFLAISHKNGTLTRRDKDDAILAIINVDISRDVEDEIAAIFAIG